MVRSVHFADTIPIKSNPRAQYIPYMLTISAQQFDILIWEPGVEDNNITPTKP
jgi:hypothetical protein